jgi:hypothetical protein
MCVCSYYYICVLILLYVSSYYYMCPHTTICVHILLYMCPHTAICVLRSVDEELRLSEDDAHSKDRQRFMASIVNRSKQVSLRPHTQVA